jgi:hypothetical protein
MKLREGWGTLDGGKMKTKYKRGPSAYRDGSTLGKGDPRYWLQRERNRNSL